MKIEQTWCPGCDAMTIPNYQNHCDWCEGKLETDLDSYSVQRATEVTLVLNNMEKV